MALAIGLVRGSCDNGNDGGVGRGGDVGATDSERDGGGCCGDGVHVAKDEGEGDDGGRAECVETEGGSGDGARDEGVETERSVLVQAMSVCDGDGAWWSVVVAIGARVVSW